MQTHTQDIGTLTTQTNWRGSISARKMLDEGMVDDGQIDQAIATIDQYFIAENRQAETRCIDGRCCPTLREDQLGAQVPGGTPGAALAYRLSQLVEDFDVGVFTDDAHYMLRRTLDLGFMPGDHRDTHGHGIGCGAIDKMDAALAAMLSPELVGDHKRLVKGLLSTQFDEAIYMQILGAGVVLEGRIEQYMQNREAAIAEIEAAIHHQVSVLEGEHHECLMIVNLISGTTFATKRLSDDYEGMQAFNYDVWRTFELAEKLFENEKNEVAKLRFIMARVATAVATLMVLTDGSQRLVIRS